MIVNNSWEKGLNSDFAKTLTPTNTYLDGLNIRVITDEGNSTYAIENTKGTQFKFNLARLYPTYKIDVRGLSGAVTINFIGPTGFSVTFPNIELLNNEQIATAINDEIIAAGINPELIRCYFNNSFLVFYNYTSLNWTPVSSEALIELKTSAFNPCILGWTAFEDKVVIIAGNNSITSDTPENDPLAHGAIFLFKINDSTNEILSIDDQPAVDINGFTINSRILRYVGNLNLSRFYEIYKHVVVRYENSKILRVIWTDFYNSLRTLNVFEDQSPATPEELIDYLPAVNHNEPIIDEIIDGGTNPVGKYYFFYQLKSISGAETSISPVSNGIILSAGDMNDFSNFNAVQPGTNSQKSIKIYVPNVDTRYDIIRFGYILYQIPNVAETFWFDEKAISQSLEVGGRISTVLNGNENVQGTEIPVADLTQISNVNRPPEIFKTIDVVRNRLAAANAKTKFFDVEFDSRAYRFNSAAIAELYNSIDSFGNPSVKIDYNVPEVEISGSVPSGTFYQQLLQIPDTFDLINPYNNEDPSDPFNGGNWLANSQYYLESGSTRGGFGPNISYRFSEHIDNVITEGFSFTNDASTITPKRFNNLDSILLNGRNYKVDGSFTSMKSPYIKSLYTGYARGEVYRFGIVFHDLKGYPTPVHWIGDIKFPDFTEITLQSGAEHDEAIQIGIEFTLDTTTAQFQAIKDKISGWSYVRMQRFETDKTKLGSGIMNNLYFNANYYINNYFGNNNSVTFTPVLNYWNIDFPNSHFGIDNKFLQGDRIRIFATGVRSTVPSPYASPNLIDIYRGTHSFRQYTYETLSNSYGATRNRDIINRLRVDRSRNANRIVNVFGSGFDYYNMSTDLIADANIERFESFGNLTDIININIDNLSLPANYNKYMFSYERYNTAQYGGRTRSARYNNKYIPISYRSYNPSMGFTIVNNICFNGDTVVVFYDHQKHDKNDTPQTGFEGANNRYGYAQYYFAECHSFNPEHRQMLGNQHASTRISTSIIYNDNINITNRAFDNENIYSIFLSLPLNPNLETVEPNTIYITENKIDGERTDSWRFFRINNALSVKGNLGGIQRIVSFRDKLYYFQENGFGIAAIEERVIINDGDGAETQLGTGGVLSRYDYISEQVGLSHMWAIVPTGNSIYFYNAYLQKFFRFTGEGTQPLSDVAGLSGYFRNLNPLIKTRDKLLLDNQGSLHMEFDPVYNTVFFTSNIPEEKFTISFNELLGAFESKHSFQPHMYLNTKRKLISCIIEDTTGILRETHLHNEGNRNVYYGDYHPSKVKFRVNDVSSSQIAKMSKIFDNFAFVNEYYENGVNINDSFDEIRCTNDYQDTGVVNANNTLRQFIRDWRMVVPLENTTARLKPRMVDKYMDVEITYDLLDSLTKDLHVILHNVTTDYSLRGQIINQALKK